MRKFNQTPEPRGADVVPLRYFIQRHAASRLHYDFRLEIDGVLKSWAVPKGPSLDPSQKRLAVHVEDHPVEYGNFEGNIPKGNYGAGTVLLWDKGIWHADGDPETAYKDGHIKVHLSGKKLHGAWALVRIAKDPKNWLLIKEKDVFAGESDITVQRPESVGGDSPVANSLPAIAFQLAATALKPPKGDDWLFEIKLDGYRVLARIQAGQTQLLTRGGKDWSERFPRVVAALTALPVRDAILDGEMVVLDKSGASNFAALAEALGRSDDRSIVFFPFDLLYHDGEDLRKLPLIERKERLATLLATMKNPVRYLEHVVGQGEAFVGTTCELGLEGAVAKRASAVYRSGRSDSWQKVKCLQREEFVVVGWTDPGGSRTGFGALLVASRKSAESPLVYAGRVGTGFDERSLRELHTRLVALARTPMPVENPPTGVEAKRVHWVEPTLVGEIGFLGWSPGGRLRHPVWKGLREDKPAAEVVKDATIGAAPVKGRPVVAQPVRAARGGKKLAGVAISNAGRVIDAASGLTKGGLAAWYEQAATHLLPELLGRPLSVIRCPSGVGHACFFQKHLGEGFPAAIGTLRIPGSDGATDHISVSDVAGLLSLVQMGVIEFHPWGSRAAHIDQPDRIIFDLDPDPTLPWQAIVEGAVAIRAKLTDLGLISFVRTTGGKGLHVVAPIEPTLDWDVVKPITKAIAETLVSDSPATFTANASKAKRQGKIFVDYLRNGRGATAVASWSVRARPGAAVAVPVSWGELPGLTGGDHFSVAAATARLALPSPWATFATVRQQLDQAARGSETSAVAPHVCLHDAQS